MNRLLDRLPRGLEAAAWAGVAIGLAAAFVSLPPIERRDPVFPIVLGVIAVTIGVSSWMRGPRRIGAYAVAAGAFGLLIGYLATRSSVSNARLVAVARPADPRRGPRATSVTCVHGDTLLAGPAPPRYAGSAPSACATLRRT